MLSSFEQAAPFPPPRFSILCLPWCNLINTQPAFDRKAHPKKNPHTRFPFWHLSGHADIAHGERGPVADARRLPFVPVSQERQEQRIARLMETFTATSYADELRSAESSTGDPLPSDAVAGPFLKTSSLPVILRERVERMEKQRSDRKEKTEVRIKRKRLEHQKAENQARLDSLEDDLTRETLERMSAFYEHLANRDAEEDTDKLAKKQDSRKDSPEVKNYLRTQPAAQQMRGSGRPSWLEGDEKDPFRIDPRVSLRTA